VVDTNTLIQIGQRRRTSEYFRENAVLPEEVLREAKHFPDIDMLRKNLHPTTPHVLECLIKVMSNVPATDTSLVNLYQNAGGADPLIIACALDGRSKDSVYLVAPEWVVVTADDAVSRKAQEFGLTVMSNAQLAEVIDASIASDSLNTSDSPHADV